MVDQNPHLIRAFITRVGLLITAFFAHRGDWVRLVDPLVETGIETIAGSAIAMLTIIEHGDDTFCTIGRSDKGLDTGVANRLFAGDQGIDRHALAGELLHRGQQQGHGRDIAVAADNHPVG